MSAASPTRVGRSRSVSPQLPASAFEPDIWFAASNIWYSLGDDKKPVRQQPQKTSVYVLVPERTVWEATITSGSDWFTLESGGPFTGPNLVTLSAKECNTGSERRGEMLVMASGRPLLRRRLRQASGVPLHTLNTSVLAVPFSTTPRVMELGIAGKFIGTQLQKIPKQILGIPVRLIIVIIVDLIVVLLGILVILLRFFAFVLDPGLRESVTWFPPPAQPTPILDQITELTLPAGNAQTLPPQVPVTTVYLLLEIYLLVVYIAEVALSK